MTDRSEIKGKRILFVTGRLAEYGLREVLNKLSQQLQFHYELTVMPITVAALMTPAWIARHLQIPDNLDLIVVPGYCDNNLEDLQKTTTVPIELGPHDLRRLPKHFGLGYQIPDDYGQYDIEILGEINHAPRLSIESILEQAKALKDSGADYIDVGCDPGSEWLGVGECVKQLVDAGFQVSIDSLNSSEISNAVEAGASLVLSVNRSNRDAAVDWGVPVVVIPDDFATLGGLDETVEFLATAGVPIRIDPILEPIGCGFTASLERYIQVRKRYPDAEMMMGIGNLSELTDVDSAGVNTLLLGICQELGIRTVLTTEVINWARSSVKECDIARRMVHHAVNHGIPPKHLETLLLTLRDEEISSFGDEFLENLAASIKDPNYRIYAERDEIHLVSAGLHLSDKDPFKLFERLANGEGQNKPPHNLDASHSFYLGYEMAKALTAITLSKQYTQDQALNWGYLTSEEKSHRLTRSRTDKHKSNQD
ncbi:MAG: dihydropteroate synthase [Planctomycetaceae bacterium]|nr:dihydropteroate synthase [Planctomycetaceae bacterium]